MDNPENKNGMVRLKVGEDYKLCGVYLRTRNMAFKIQVTVYFIFCKAVAVIGIFDKIVVKCQRKEIKTKGTAMDFQDKGDLEGFYLGDGGLNQVGNPVLRSVRLSTARSGEVYFMTESKADKIKN